MSQTLRRALTIDPASYDEEARTIELCYATTAPVDRYDYTEILAISEEAIDTTRLDAGAVYLIRDHMPYGDPLGLIVSHRIDGDRAYATIRLSENDQIAGVLKDIASGLYRTCSVGYQVMKTEIEETDSGSVVTVVRWMPFEVSMTVIPADINAQTRSNPSTKGTQMTKKTGARAAARADETLVDETVEEAGEIVVTITPNAEGEADVVVETVTTEDETDEDEDEAVDEVAEERSRVASIYALGLRHSVSPDAVARAISAGSSEQEFRSMIKRNRVSGGAAPVMTARTRITRDAGETLARGAADAFYSRLSGSAPSDQARALRDLSLVEIGREFARSMGEDGQADRRSLYRMMTRAAAMHTTSDFTFLGSLGQAISRRIRERFEERPQTFDPFVERTRVRDFRPVETVSAGSFPEMKLIPEGAEIEFGTASSEGGAFRIAKYGRAISFSFEAFINDDLRWIDSLIRSATNTAARLESNLVYGALLDGRKLADGKPLFAPARGNVIAQALDVQGLNIAATALMKQKDAEGNAIGLTPRILIVGPDSAMAANRLLTPVVATTAADVNPFASANLVPVIDPRIEGDDWYLLAGNEGDVIELAGLDGYEGIQVEEEWDPKTSAYVYYAKYHGGAQATGWRGMIKSTGAA